MKQITIKAILVTVAATVFLVGMSELTNYHDYKDIRGIGDIFVGIAIGVIYHYYQQVKELCKDSTTGIWMRSVVENRLIAHERRHNDITIAILDVNGLKNINDLSGHELGDSLLREVGRRLSLHKKVHPRHMVGRLGGDEFIVIAPKTESSKLIQQMNKLIREGHTFGTWPIACAGVARTRVGSRDALGCADRAMYRAKRHYYETGYDGVLAYDILLDGSPKASKDRRAVYRVDAGMN